MGGKWLGVLKELAPNVRRVGALFTSDAAPHASFLAAAEAAAPSLGVKITIVNIQDKASIETAITAFADQSDSGLLVFPHPNTIANRALINALAARYRLPAIYPYRYFATEGGLVSYGPDQIDQWRGAARYVDRILKGEKPADLPVQAPTRFELVINLHGRPRPRPGCASNASRPCRRGNRIDQSTSGFGGYCCKSLFGVANENS